MAGSIALSLTQRFDKTSHLPLDGGQVYFYAAGTTTPQSAYQDISLTIPWPNPLTLDSGGNCPQLFFDDGYIKFRLTNAAGVTQIEADFVLVLGPTSGGGAAPSVDATTILATGDLKARYGTGALTGFVRANGRTIGSATSGGSERANSDTQALFEYLWNEDANLTVSTGRGASANADWVANKNIALPDWRGRALSFLDDMGNSAAGRLTATHFGTSATVLGAASTTSQSRTLATANLPAYSPGGSFTSDQSDIVRSSGLNLFTPSVLGAGPLVAPASGSSNITGITGSLTGTAQGGTATPLSIIPPTMLTTFYIKL